METTQFLQSWRVKHFVAHYGTTPLSSDKLAISGAFHYLFFLSAASLFTSCHFFSQSSWYLGAASCFLSTLSMALKKKHFRCELLKMDVRDFRFEISALQAHNDHAIKLSGGHLEANVDEPKPLLLEHSCLYWKIKNENLEPRWSSAERCYVTRR